MAITAPASNATVTGTFKVTATAADTGPSGLQSVAFYLDGALQQTVAAAPFTWSWNTKKAGLGSHTPRRRRDRRRRQYDDLHGRRSQGRLARPTMSASP